MADLFLLTADEPPLHEYVCCGLRVEAPYAPNCAKCKKEMEPAD